MLLATLSLGVAAIAMVLLWRQQTVAAAGLRELRRQRAVLDSVLDSVGEGVLAMTPARELFAVNAAALSILGAGFPTKRLPEDWRDLIVATNEDGTLMLPQDGPLARAARGESVSDFVYHIRTRTEVGPGRWVSASSRPIFGEDGSVVAGVVTLRDVTDQRQHADELRALSLRDELTQLYNRRGFLALAEQHVKTAIRGGQPFTLLYADLNGLKRINDELGHVVGDRAITDAARVLKNTFRDSDVVARLGGDEFVVLIADAGPANGDVLIRRLRDATRAHNKPGGPYRLSMSIGLAFYDPHEPQPLHDLIAAADQRMYSAKRGPRSSVAPLSIVGE
ncbi:MAG TPA: diguanylate cyclase [Polyangiaceae bacterium]|jgi:diguanylate cyclase (GGDEF)-like protein